MPALQQDVWGKAETAALFPGGAAPWAPQPMGAGAGLKIDNCRSKTEEGLLEISTIPAPSK